MPRVLFVHHRPQLSGAVRSLALLASALDDRWELHALVPAGHAAETLRRAGVTIRTAPVPAFTHTWDVQYHGLRWLVLCRELIAVPSHTRALRRALTEIRPDIVHVNDSVMLLSGALAARAGVPVVWHLRSSLAHSGGDRRGRFVCSRIDRDGTAAIAIDEDVASTFRLRLPVHVIPNPVLIQDGPTAALEVPNGRISIGYFGFLRRQKGWPEFLRALRILVDEGRAAHAVFVGGAIRPSESFRGLRGHSLRAMGVPDEEGDFRRLVRELALSDHVSVIPFAGDPLPYMRAVDIVVFPNQGAGLGRPVLEAIALGKPVVASGSPTARGILVPEETGILLERATPGALAEALARLVTGPGLRARFGVRAQALIASPEAHAARVASVYEAVLEADPTRSA